ncbi:hypothetical protein JW977_01105 [Candidatus Falkowbacteria bacterium]|nr:hypothetical protein [Candidatus Falkowbacteria bacterium]
MVFLGIDWGKIFSVPFWLEVNPGELSDLFEKFFFGVLIINYGLYFVSRAYQKRLIASREFIKAKFCQKTANFFLTMAVSFTFIFFFRYEAIPFLGGRFWVFFWLIAGLAWLIYLIRYYFFHVKNQLKELEQKQKIKKYM